MMSSIIPSKIHKVPRHGGFHKWGYPKMIKMDDLGLPPFQETSICFNGGEPTQLPQRTPGH